MADEKKLMEDLSRERIDMERELRERELQEKLEREKQFIARRHALLSRQDHDEERSVRSMRSSQNSIQRTEDWVRQTGSGVVGCGDTVQQIQASTSANSGHPDEASLVNAQGVHPSSTPLRTANESPPLGDAPMANTGSEVRSIPQTVESITIEDSEDFAEGAVGLNLNKCDPSQNPSNLPLVDLQPYEDILKLEEVPPTGAIPKINRFGGHCYKRWSAETGELRKQNALLHHQQSEAELRVVHELMVKHRTDMDTRRKREMELVHRISSLEKQHADELKQVCEAEKDLRTQIERRDVEETALKIRIETLEKQLVEEKKRSRHSEADMRDQHEASKNAKRFDYS